MYSKELKEYCIQLREWEMSYQCIADKISDEYNINVNPETIRLRYQEYNTTSDEQEIQRMCIETAKQKLEKKKERVKQKLYDKAMECLVEKDWFMETLRDAIINWKPLPVKQENRNTDNTKWNDDMIYLFISDLHYGRTSDELRKSFVMLQDKLLTLRNNGYSNITVFDLWDNVEWVSIMHNQQMFDNDVNGVWQILDVADLLEAFLYDLYSIWYKVKFYWVTKSNHDRACVEYKDDVERIPAIVIYELMRRGLSNTDVDIQYFYDAVWTVISENYNFIIHHWDGKWNKTKSDEILRLYWDSNYENIIVSWHWHDSYLESWTKYLRVRVPSMNVCSTYEKFCYLQANIPWCFMMFSDGTPTFLHFKREEKNEEGWFY